MRIIRLKEVIENTGLSRSTIYKYVGEGMFPKPVPLGGRTVGWVDQEIDEWILAKIESRDAEKQGHASCYLEQHIAVLYSIVPFSFADTGKLWFGVILRA